MTEQLATGGIVLCGGKSSRMGQSKALLPVGAEAMLSRVVRILKEAVSKVVVVAARGQELPLLPEDVTVAYDEYDALGPLAGLATGLAALSGIAGAAYVTACDAPLLKPGFVRGMIGLLGDYDLVMPCDGEYHYPLAAVYRLSVESTARHLISAGRLRPYFLIERVNSREVSLSELRSIDPALDSLRNVNTPEDYRSVLRECGLCE